MSIKSRQKSSRANRELAALFRAAGFSSVSCTHGVLNNHTLPGLSVEVRRTQRLRLEEAMVAAEATAEGTIPLVAHRSDHHPWRITLSLSDFFRLYEAFCQRPRPDPAPPTAEAYHD